jgi:uncharacterized damage-inducible protein DinB
MDDRSVLEQVLQAWRVNSSVNVKLIRRIPQKGFDAVPLASRGRTVRAQLVHMQKVHAGWMKYNGAKLSRNARPFRGRVSPDRKQLVTAFRATGAAVEAYVRDRLRTGKRIGFFQGKPLRWLCYLMAHDAHHRGQIALALKQNGLKLPTKVALNDLWYSWYGGDPK